MKLDSMVIFIGIELGMDIFSFEFQTKCGIMHLFESFMSIYFLNFLIKWCCEQYSGEYVASFGVL